MRTRRLRRLPTRWRFGPSISTGRRFRGSSGQGAWRPTGEGATRRRMTVLYIDADACPVKDEVYKVAARHGFKTFVVSNSWIRVPLTPVIEQIVVDAGPDVADDWIAERCGPGDVVVTNDIPLADRVLKAGGAALAPNGRVFS